MAVLTGSDDKDIGGFVLVQELCNGLNACIGLADIENIQPIAADTVDELLHILAFLLGTDMDTGGEVLLYGDERFL